ncbi:hypothetical protein POM88_001871 [Heracleum sosnowskyi]|uniref:Uncharacterized protein n=1 Tax=Heracleum sosnowskyi TaxID=360622 RepID=A0AAD8JGQ3_9APIA|nr:hypothetical protein POM88_001871 [Heracleum sosnowskyi]
MEPALEIGKIYLFENFTVKEYREEDKFRCIMKEIQIIFSSETKVSDLDESEVCIDRAGFDFYDIADLKELTKQTTYLTDVIGVILDAEINLAKFNNKRGRVTEWHEEVDVSNVGASTFYLNYDHYSVNHLRTMLKGPDFKEYPKSMVHFEPLQVLTIKQIKELGEDYIEKKVLCNVKVKKVQRQEKWFKYICTSCYKETNWLEQTHSCICVPREEDDNQFPKHLETIVDEHNRFQIQIQRGQNSKDPYIYVAKDMIKQYPSEVNSVDTDSNQPRPLEESYGEPSASTFHIDTMSENN